MEVHDNLGTIVGAGIDTLWMPALPGQVQLMLAVRLTGTADELDPTVPHALTNRIRDPRGDLLAEVGGELALGGESARPEWLVGVMLPVVVGFQANEEGTYTLELTVDDSTAALPIHVVVGSPEEA